MGEAEKANKISRARICFPRAEIFRADFAAVYSATRGQEPAGLFSHASSARRGFSKVALDVRARARGGWERGSAGEGAQALRIGYILRAPLKAHPQPAIIDRSKIVSRAVRPELPRVDLFDK